MSFSSTAATFASAAATALRLASVKMCIRDSEDGERKAKNLKRLLEVATECADGGYETVYEFLRFAERVKKGEIKLAGTSDTSAGGVKIMTVHHSKGLQFPVVFMAGLTSLSLIHI